MCSRMCMVFSWFLVVFLPAGHDLFGAPAQDENPLVEYQSKYPLKPDSPNARPTYRVMLKLKPDASLASFISLVNGWYFIQQWLVLSKLPEPLEVVADLAAFDKSALLEYLAKLDIVEEVSEAGDFPESRIMGECGWREAFNSAPFELLLKQIRPGMHGSEVEYLLGDHHGREVLNRICTVLRYDFGLGLHCHLLLAVRFIKGRVERIDSEYETAYPRVDGPAALAGGDSGECGEYVSGQDERSQDLDLLGLIDLERDRLSGEWSFKDGGLLMEGGRRPKLMLPMAPKVGYELDVDFTILTGVQFGFTLPLNPGMTLIWFKAAHKGGADTIDLDMKYGAAPYLVKKTPSRALAGGRNRMIIRVELDGEDARINAIQEGERVLLWKGPKDSFCAVKEYAMPEESIGLTNWGTRVHFHRLVLRLLSEEPVPETVKQEENIPGDEREEEASFEVPPGFELMVLKTFSCNGKRNMVHLYVHKKTGLEFVLVPGGTFTMDSAADDPYKYDNETPVRQVTVDPFLICRTECTQEAWDRFDVHDIRQWRAPDLPIERVDWHECQEWCRKAGLRLPSSAEWECACRAGTSTPYYFGKTEKELGEHAWYMKNSDGKTHKVAKKKPNAFGLHDMYGNVWEWCQDAYLEGGSEAPAEGTPGKDPNPSRYIGRGGCWESQSRYCRSAMLGTFRPDLNDNSLGFRPAASVRRSQ